jgi:hypothetical protein
MREKFGIGDSGVSQERRRFAGRIKGEGELKKIGVIKGNI